MQFMLILNETPEDFAQRTDPELAGPYWGGWNAFLGAMTQAGIVENGDGLQPNLMAEPCQFLRPIMRPGTGLNGN